MIVRSSRTPTLSRSHVLVLALALAGACASELAAQGTSMLQKDADGTYQAAIDNADVHQVAERFAQLEGYLLAIDEQTSGTVATRFTGLDAEKAAWRMFRHYGYSVSTDSQGRPTLRIFPRGAAGVPPTVRPAQARIEITPRPPCPPPPAPLAGARREPGTDFRAKDGPGDPEAELAAIRQRILSEGRNATSDEDEAIARLGARAAPPAAPPSEADRAALADARAQQDADSTRAKELGDAMAALEPQLEGLSESERAQRIAALKAKILGAQ